MRDEFYPLPLFLLKANPSPFQPLTLSTPSDSSAPPLRGFIGSDNLSLHSKPKTQ